MLITTYINVPSTVYLDLQAVAAAPAVVVAADNINNIFPVVKNPLSLM